MLFRSLSEFSMLLETLIRPESMQWLDKDADKPVAATALVGSMELLVPMAGLIDKDAELARLDKEIERKQKDLERTIGKINNPNFVDKAPAEVVEKERDKLDELKESVDKLNQQRSSIELM